MLALAALALSWGGPSFCQETRQASGVKVGEVTDTSAIVWTRLTAAAKRNEPGVPFKDSAGNTSKLEGACPGAAGRVRLRYGTRVDLPDDAASPWVEVTETTDYSHQFHLAGLKPGTLHHYAVETAGSHGEPIHGVLRGTFETAPRRTAEVPITFCVLTCQGYHDIDHKDGFHIYPAMAKLAPKFVAFTGDNVYYDNDEPQAKSAPLARYHWERMYSKPRHVELLKSVGTYWEKDDHDTLANDSWPGKKVGDLTFEEGQRIFRRQVPMGETIYRTFRWGKHLQIWLTDGRDFRSPNKMPDGPEKTIWGREQKEWLKSTLEKSDATWKIVISPTPIVGPDRAAKNDNHANKGFSHEGNEIRAFLKSAAPENAFTMCGDRHWQYHSVHPVTGLNEFSVGAASDEHAGGSPGLDKEYHRFHRVKGGFMSVTAAGDAIVFRHHDVHGAVVNEFKKGAK
jgi:alkaline phosphatase D